jgi:phenylacetic acid degradation operon negative regulatory protein
MAGSLYLTLSMLAFDSEMAEATACWILSRLSGSGQLRRKLARLVAAGAIMISPQRQMDQRILRLTDKVRCHLLGGVDPEVEWRRCWDGVWRLAVFDIPESSLALRTRLRRRLREFRFGMLQRSVWINPHPVDAFRQSLDETGLVPERLTYFAARPVGGESHAALVNSAWDFSRLAEDYAAYREILRLRPGRISGTAARWFRWLDAEHLAWCRIARRDPFLPLELQPPGYPGQAAWAERRGALDEFARVVAAGTRAETLVTRALA